jgi:hypothetical protein
VDNIDPEEMNRDHEDERMDRSGYDRCLARGKDAARARRECQKHAWTQNKEEKGD